MYKLSTAVRNFAAPYKRGSVRCTVTGKRGNDVLTDPRLNKGTGFDMGERDRLGIRGLVPSKNLNLEQQ